MNSAVGGCIIEPAWKIIEAGRNYYGDHGIFQDISCKNVPGQRIGLSPHRPGVYRAVNDILAARGGCEPHLTSHAAANMRIGNDRDFLIRVVSQCLPYIGYPRSLNALACVNKAAQG